jgi:hypothetical protein
LKFEKAGTEGLPLCEISGGAKSGSSLGLSGKFKLLFFSSILAALI